MKRVAAVLKWAGVIVLLLLVCFVAFVYIRTDRTYEADYPALAATSDSVLIARGRHLVYGPAHCVDCHTPPDSEERLNSGEAVPLSGGREFNLPIGTIRTPNITPDPETGIGTYTDGEIARALRYGVKRDGQALMDFMPFYDLSDRDVTAILSFLRASEPVRNPVPPTSWNFAGNAVRALGLIKPMGDADVPPAPPEDTTAAYGGYVANSIANCRGCHTERDMMTGAYIGESFAGGMVFDVNMEDGSTRYLATPNLTPDASTGRIAKWSEEMFVARFRAGDILDGSVMPWDRYRLMTDLELRAIFRYLSALNPVTLPRPIPAGWLNEEPEI